MLHNMSPQPSKEQLPLIDQLRVGIIFKIMINNEVPRKEAGKHSYLKVEEENDFVFH